MAGLTYRVTAAGRDRPVAYGSPTAWAHNAQALADSAVMDVRQIDPGLTAELTVAVWQRREGESIELPVPDGAEVFEYPATH
jgi:hypothetical protein